MKVYHVLKIKSTNTEILNALQTYIQSAISELKYVRVVQGQLQAAFVDICVQLSMLQTCADRCMNVDKEYYLGCDVVQEQNGIVVSGYTLFSESMFPVLFCDDYAPVESVVTEVQATFDQLRGIAISNR